jgi:antitoxin VapB
MALQIANPVVVKKVERLAKAVGLSKTAAVERAVDRLLAETVGVAKSRNTASASMAALLAQLDQVADRKDAFDPLAWDEHGLPR